MSDFDLSFRKMVLTLAMAALIWLPAAQVQTAQGATVVDILPPEIKTIADNAKAIAGVYSGFSGSLDAALVIADMLGIMKKFDQAEEFRKLHQHLDDLGVALDEGFSLDNREDHLAMALEAVKTAEQAVKSYTMPLRYDSPSAVTRV